jgi:4-hydroxymandelate oxidase
LEDTVKSWANLDELRALAQAKSDPAVWAVIEDGADDELTLRDNTAAWSRMLLRPRVLRGVANVDTATTVLGSPVVAPIVVGPSGRHGLFHPDAELATASGAAAARTLMTVATASSRSLEEVAAGAPGAPRWFQLYVTRDRAWTEELLARAEAAAFRAIVLTVDVPVVGRRRGTLRRPVVEGPRWGNAVARFGAAATYGQPDFAGGIDPGLGFEDIGWLCSRTRLPIVVKGVLRGDDAVRCLDAGASAIVVSNHGGRQLDTAVAGADALGEVVEAVGQRAEVYVDGGVRRGTDIVKALALGARAVLVVRPVLHGLLLSGADGVEAVLKYLGDELRHTMMLCGVDRIDAIDHDLLVEGPGRRVS